jgi:two-component system, NtrC family, response regulator HydG
MIAYLVVREGHKWRDVYRLIPGQTITVGRSPSNKIVLNDEVCSRQHCEIFPSGDRWFVKDLQSRNGTLLAGEPLAGDAELSPGQVIQIGLFELAFTHDLSQAFPPDESHAIEADTGTAWDAGITAPVSEPTITHRKGENRFARGRPEAIGRDRTGQELAHLYRLALAMGGAKTPKQLAEAVLAGLLAGTNADTGAVLMLPVAIGPDQEGGELTVAACRAPEGDVYQRVTPRLASAVLKNREAVLARDTTEDSLIADRDRAGHIHATSVICAPVRHGDKLHGLLHMSCTRPGRNLDEDDLEFALAVAEQYALALVNVRRQESLAEGLARVRGENTSLREQLEIVSELVGNSPPMQRLKDNIGCIGPTDATVLIRGESGVGKELVARALHFNSRRKGGPFVCMNCAALSESLLESELFGHEKGSFTGATNRKMGKFEQAHKGTLMLDEVGEMSPAIQAKFLRVLEGHPFERVGGGESVKVDVRVVAATNRDLEEAVEKGQFRKDLYFRLQVVELRIDPLRDRRDDISALAEFFLEKFVAKTGRPLRGYSPTALEKLVDYDWPGNVRELQNTIERAVILSRGEIVEAEDIQLSRLRREAGEVRADGIPGAVGGPLVSLDSLEQQYILQVLDHTAWNKTQAAQILGIERSTLDRKLKRYQVGRPEEE